MAKAKVAPSRHDLTAEEIALEMSRCSLDPVYAINQYAVILVRQDDGSRTIERFSLWAYQTRLVMAFARGGHFMILKARQLGITTVVCAYLTWFAIFRPNSFVLVLSKREDEAQKLLERIKTTYDRFPPWLREVVPKGETWNSTTATWGNGSTVQSIAATEGTGRSETASVVFIDEADYIPDLKATYQAVKPTVDGPGGQMILASTSQGPLRYWKDLWDTAMQRRGKLRAVFFPWHVRPGRTQEWLDAETSEYSLHQRKREYPSTWIDAFTSAEGLVYPDFESGVHMEPMVYHPETKTVSCARYEPFHVSYFIGGVDWNVALPGCVIVVAVTTEGTLLVVDGHYEAGLPILAEDPEILSWTQIARQFHKHYSLQRVYCDWQPDAITTFQRSGIPAQKASKDVDSGIAAVTAILKKRADTGKPGVLFSASLGFITQEMYSYKRREIGGLITDRVVKTDDHFCDALRYAVAGLARGTPKITVLS